MQQDLSSINGRYFIKNNIELLCDSFCIVYFIHLHEDRSEIWFCFPPVNLHKLQQEKTFSGKLLLLLLSSR